MSTLGGLISYSNRWRSKKEIESKKNPNWLPKDKWEAKLRKEGKWIDYKK